jgi:hypothetical protein
MSGEQRFHREARPAPFKPEFGLVVIVLFCALGLFATLAVFPSYDTWTPNQLTASP